MVSGDDHCDIRGDEVPNNNCGCHEGYHELGIHAPGWSAPKPEQA
jgi:hypothetical protein